MTNTFCAYTGNRDEAIVAYLYDDITPLERAAFESHVAGCETCREELADLREVRHSMADWTPPAFQSAIFNRQSAISPARSWWSDVPLWAQAAAAVLVLGVAAGAANVNVHHDEHGFTVRTGWMRAPEPAAAAREAEAPWRADLAKLETDMRAELRSTSARTVSAAMVVPPVARASADDAAILREVKAVVDASEKRQQTELALRIAQLARDTHAERAADITSINRMLGQMQSNTGFEVAQTRQQLQNLARTVSLTVPAR